MSWSSAALHFNLIKLFCVDEGHEMKLKASKWTYSIVVKLLFPRSRIELCGGEIQHFNPLTSVIRDAGWCVSVSPWGRAGSSWCWAAEERWWWPSERRSTRPESRATAGWSHTGWWRCSLQRIHCSHKERRERESRCVEGDTQEWIFTPVPSRLQNKCNRPATRADRREFKKITERLAACSKWRNWC